WIDRNELPRALQCHAVRRWRRAGSPHLGCDAEMSPDRAQAARDLLAFYLEAGADACIVETPVDRFADPTHSSPPPESGRSARDARREGVNFKKADPTPDRLRRDNRSEASASLVTAAEGRLRPPLLREGKSLAATAPPPVPEAAVMAARE